MRKVDDKLYFEDGDDGVRETFEHGIQDSFGVDSFIDKLFRAVGGISETHRVNWDTVVELARKDGLIGPDDGLIWNDRHKRFTVVKNRYPSHTRKDRGVGENVYPEPQ